MEAFSMDLRERVIAAYDRGDGSTRQLAKVFGVSGSWIRELLRLRRERSSIAAIEYKPGPKPKLTDEHLDRMCLLVSEEPDLTAEEIRRRLRLPLSASRVSAILLETGFTRKKSPSCQRNSSRTTCGSNGSVLPVG